MSSSDNFPDWSVFSEREAPLEINLLSPASEMAAALQTLRADLDAAHREREETHSEGLKALAEQAVFVVQLAAALDLYQPELTHASLVKVHRHLRVLKDQMLDALQRASLEVVVPLGKPFEEVAASVQVVGWRHHEQFTHEVVAEVMEPIVTSKGALVRPGKVVMGAPPEQAVTEPARVGQSEKTE